MNNKMKALILVGTLIQFFASSVLADESSAPGKKLCDLTVEKVSKKITNSEVLYDSMDCSRSAGDRFLHAYLKCQLVLMKSHGFNEAEANNICYHNSVQTEQWPSVMGGRLPDGWGTCGITLVLTFEKTVSVEPTTEAELREQQCKKITSCFENKLNEGDIDVLPKIAILGKLKGCMTDNDLSILSPNRGIAETFAPAGADSSKVTTRRKVNKAPRSEAVARTAEDAEAAR